MVENVGEALLDQCKEVSRWLKSIAHPVRLKILCVLLRGEKNVSDLMKECGTSQSLMSQWLSKMKAEGLLVVRREGHQMLYSVRSDETVALLAAIRDILSKRKDVL